ncbi:MAG TPA: hypothetical protein VHK69_15620 [Chitinophagaceae bacterium]|jgi:hypothetical protein|nr:hypothetical protein [Chitinophagaceae bacterium]
MYQRVLLPAALLFCFLTKAEAQRVFEWGIKPSELVVRQLEVHMAFGRSSKSLYGFLLGFRPSTRDSGSIPTEGSGLTGAYAFNHANRLYRGYTAGFVQKTYINRARDIFVGTDLFYRNWSFEKKPAFFDNPDGYRFQGTRSEHVHVLALKLLGGVTYYSRRRLGKGRPYLDFYSGAGVRYKIQAFETFDGFVNDIYYLYHKERYYHWVPSLHLGVRIGLRYERS